MTNPDSIIRLHSRAGGRGSIYEANAPYQTYSTGIFSGAGVSQNTSPDMNIIVGGAVGDTTAASPNNPNIIIGTNPQGYKIMLDIVGTTVLPVTTPASNKRITQVVIYSNDLSATSTEATTTGSPSQNGIILVNGAASASPKAPADSDIRSAITADGGTGTNAVYAVIASMTIASNTTTITNDIISRRHSYLNSTSIIFPDRTKIQFREVMQHGNISGTTFNAPNISGYKFVAWIEVVTRGAIQHWYPESPLSQRSKFFRSSSDNANCDVVGVAMYVSK